MQFSDTNFGTVRNGVLVLSGFVIRVTVNMGALVVRDGIKGADVERRFPRAGCPVSRLIAVQPEGIITFAALRWLHNVGSFFVHLDYDGTPIVTSLPRVNTPAALRRAQAATTIETRLGKAIAGSLVREKMTGQLTTLRSFGLHTAADEIGAICERIQPRTAALDLLGAEGIASAIYWQALAHVPLQFGKRQAVPDHWRVFGARRSSITGDPRGAVLPAQAVLNYLYGVLASEITIALHATGLDPALGILHADKEGRASLAYDLMEPARPVLDRWLLHWLQSVTFTKRDFREDIYGFIRVTHPLNSHLAMTAALWRGIAEQLAQWIYRRLSDETPRLRLTGVDMLAAEATRRAVRWRLGNAMQRPIPATCAECGRALPKGRRKFCSGDCSASYHHDTPFQATVAAIATRHADPKRSGAANLAIGKKARRNAASRQAWRSRPEWSEADDERLCRWYTDAVYPALARCKLGAIMSATGLSKQYAIVIRAGRRVPHPRLIRQLAALVGVAWPEGFP
jgi:CRISPR-associated endonuclease Cas1